MVFSCSRKKTIGDSYMLFEVHGTVCGDLFQIFAEEFPYLGSCVHILFGPRVLAVNNFIEPYFIAVCAVDKAVRDHLKRSKYVKQFRPGIYGEGEDGVTVVTLK